MCELPCTVIITVKKGNIVYIMHDVGTATSSDKMADKRLRKNSIVCAEIN